jgi:hypothetical protein
MLICYRWIDWVSGLHGLGRGLQIHREKPTTTATATTTTSTSTGCEEAEIDGAG